MTSRKSGRREDSPVTSENAQPITFVVPGLESLTADRSRGAVRAPTTPVPTQGRIKQSVHVGAARGEGAEVRVTAVPGEDVIVLHLAGGPELMLHPDNARD